jgi:hypothetical protein
MKVRTRASFSLTLILSFSSLAFDDWGKKKNLEGTPVLRLSDRQISDAFRAANYTAEEIQMFTQALRARINELMAVTNRVKEG